MPLVAFLQGDQEARQAEDEKTLRLKDVPLPTASQIASSARKSETIGRLRRPIMIGADAIR